MKKQPLFNALLGDYAPKLVLGGEVPLTGYPGYAIKSFMDAYFPSLAPTNAIAPLLYASGLSYIESTTGTESYMQASIVKYRWDTDVSYDVPLLTWLTFRFNWNSYICIDHDLWAHYYQVGCIINGVLAPNSQSGAFFGYASGEQPPSYNRISSWQLGYSLNF